MAHTEQVVVGPMSSQFITLNLVYKFMFIQFTF